MPTLDQLIAHRGWQQNYPENTLLGIQKAIDAGAKHIECDVLLSRDGVFFLAHDDNLLRLSAVDKNIADLHSTQLDKMPCYEPNRLGDSFKQEKLASLTKLLKLAQSHPKVMFYIELKQGAIDSHGLKYCLQSLSDLLAGFKNTVLISFNQQAIIDAKKYGIQKTGIVLSQWHGKDSVIKQCACDIAFVDEQLLSDEIIECDIPIAVYEVGSNARADRLLNQGVSLIESFDIFALEDKNG